MLKKIKAVIWDMGGVLLRSTNWSPRKQLAQDHGLTLDGIHDLVFNSESAIKATLGEIDEVAHWKNIGKHLNMDESELLQFQKRFWEGDSLDVELVNFIRGLKPDYTTALLSNAWTGARRVLTETKPCIDAFHLSVFSCEIGLAKPDPAIYGHIIKLCDVEADEAIFVDDAPENIKAANLFGIHGVLFRSSNQAIADVQAILTTTD